MTDYLGYRNIGRDAESLRVLLNTKSVPIGGLTVTSPLTYASGILAIQQANTSANGYLSSTDWNTFNGKQAALSFPLASGSGGTGVANTGKLTLATDTAITGGGTLALGGYTLTVPATGTAVLGTGTATCVAYWSDTNTLTGSSKYTASIGTDVTLTLNSTRHLSNNNSGDGQVAYRVQHFGTRIDSPTFQFARYRGTRASPEAAQNGDLVGGFIWYAADTDLSLTAGCQVMGKVAGSISSGVVPMLLDFYTREATTSAIKMRLTHDGKLGIATTSITARLEVKADGINPAQNWQNSAGTVVASVDKDGVIQASGYKSSDGTAGWSGSAALAKLTAGGTNGSLTFKNGLVTAYTAPT